MIPCINDMCSIDVPNSYRPLSENAVYLDYPFETDSSAVSILGSCNGIFLIGIYNQYVGQWNPFSGNELVYSYLCLWNPSTKQYKKLPTKLFEMPKDQRRNQYCKIVFGFGYDSSTDDYKVVRIFYDYYQSNLPYLESEVHVYSIRRHTCKRIQDIPSLPIHIKLLVFIEYGIYVSGVIHWLAKPTVATDGRFSSVPIVSFDVTSEKFREVQMPDFDCTFDLMSFGVLEECLCVYVRCDDMHVDGFMMKEYGVKESWTKIFSVGLSSNSYTRFKALWFTNDGDLYLQTCPTNDYIILYEPGKERMMRLKLCDLPTTYPQHFKVEPYIRSLVSLKV
ncbi:F-box protein cpr1 [Thalictrum thalictroides]|uniref:F-box protein cpr1 n=1 Tax=Thalictrum thalictroides TaxID=46969 RepID=A0A7J6WSG5_THATH|nr:F-box protein cpr1 [Thalictrum thalictroides]